MYDGPAHLFKLGIFLAIAFHVALKFVPPPVTIVLREKAMVRTGVPETPVYEHSYPCGGERNIRPSWKQWMIDSEPEATAVQFSANHYLRASRGTRHPLHLSGNRRIKRHWSSPSVRLCHFDPLTG
jgi:hypothetical protein